MVKYTDYNIALKSLQTWLETQPHLPIIENEVLLRFISCTDGDLEETKKLIDFQYTLRNNQSHIFLDRDPTELSLKNSFEVCDIIALPGLSPEGCKINVFRLADMDPEKFIHNDSAKVFFMCMDLATSITEPNGRPKGDISIFDLKGFSLKHIARLNLMTLRIFMKFTQEATATKIHQIHMINCPPFLDKIMGLLKPFLNADVAKLMHFHQPDTETLFDFIPKDLLLTDYGGKVDVTTLKARIFQRLVEKRDYLINKKYWEIDESKRPSNQERPQALEGNFRRLDCD